MNVIVQQALKGEIVIIPVEKVPYRKNYAPGERVMKDKTRYNRNREKMIDLSHM